MGLWELWTQVVNKLIIFMYRKLSQDLPNLLFIQANGVGVDAVKST